MSDKIDTDASRNIDLKELKTHYNQKMKITTMTMKLSRVGDLYYSCLGCQL